VRTFWEQGLDRHDLTDDGALNSKDVRKHILWQVTRVY